MRATNIKIGSSSFSKNSPSINFSPTRTEINSISLNLINKHLIETNNKCKIRKFMLEKVHRSSQTNPNRKMQYKKFLKEREREKIFARF